VWVEWFRVPIGTQAIAPTRNFKRSKIGRSSSPLEGRRFALAFICYVSICSTFKTCSIKSPFPTSDISSIPVDIVTSFGIFSTTFLQWPLHLVFYYVVLLLSNFVFLFPVSLLPLTPMNYFTSLRIISSLFSFFP
jgi:hypothetical protein